MASAADFLRRQRSQVEAGTGRVAEGPPEPREIDLFGMPSGQPPPSGPPSIPEPVGPRRESPMPQYLRGVVNAAAPVARLNPIGGMSQPGAAEIAEASGGVVATEEPRTFRGRAARVSGAATGSAGPVGGAASLVPRAGKAASATRRFIQNLIAGSGESFARRPGRFVAGEAFLGGTAGAGGLAAERRFPDSEAARVVGELLGGMAPQIAPARLMLRGAQAGSGRLSAPFTKSGARRRATERFGRATPVEGQREQAMGALERPTTVDPETGQPVLTPAQRSESAGLLALERAVLESSEELKRGGDAKIAQANRLIQESARDIGGGDPQAMSAAIREGQDYLQGLMDTRLRIAAHRIDERIEALGQGASREDANRIAREEIDKVRKLASDQEDELFLRVDPEVAVSSANAQGALNRWIGKLGKDQLEDIPRRARLRLNSGTEAKPNPRFIGETSNVREMRGLQQKLREEARQARSAGQFQKAHIADDIADNIWEDLQAAAPASNDLKEAVDFSRAFHQRFRRGALGRILGREREGGERVPESLTLERTIAGGGPGDREALDQIRAGFTDETIAQRIGSDAEAFNAAASDFMRRLFLREAVRDGQFNVNSAKAFLRSHDEVLQRMPQVRQELQEAVEAGNVRRIVENRRSSTRFDDPKVSRATLFIHKGPVKAFDEVTSDAPERSARETQKLINRAQKDETGQAMAGLKSGYVEFLLTKNRLGQRDVEGEAFISGFDLRELRQNPSVQAAERRLLSDEERRRLDTITRDLIALDRQRDVRRQVEGIIGDKPSKVSQVLARLTGATIGRHGAAAAGTGGTVQIPGILSNRLAEMVDKGVRDPAMRLIRDSIRDESLFRELLEANIEPDGSLPPKAVNRLNAWIAGVESERRQRDPDSGPEPMGGRTSEVLRRQRGPGAEALER